MKAQIPYSLSAVIGLSPMVPKKVREVRGAGVVGNQPTMAPGQSFEYTSGCPLTMPFRSMHGTSQMINDRKEQFDVEIAPFTLTERYGAVN